MPRRLRQLRFNGGLVVIIAEVYVGKSGEAGLSEVKAILLPSGDQAGKKS